MAWGGWPWWRTNASRIGRRSTKPVSRATASTLSRVWSSTSRAALSRSCSAAFAGVCPVSARLNCRGDGAATSAYSVAADFRFAIKQKPTECCSPHPIAAQYPISVQGWVDASGLQ